MVVPGFPSARQAVPSARRVHRDGTERAGAAPQTEAVPPLYPVGFSGGRVRAAGAAERRGEGAICRCRRVTFPGDVFAVNPFRALSLGWGLALGSELRAAVCTHPSPHR